MLYNEDTRLVLAERCSKQAKKFSWEITAKMTENVYDKYQVVKWELWKLYIINAY